VIRRTQSNSTKVWGVYAFSSNANLPILTMIIILTNRVWNTFSFDTVVSRRAVNKRTEIETGALAYSFKANLAWRAIIVRIAIRNAISIDTIVAFSALSIRAEVLTLTFLV